MDGFRTGDAGFFDGDGYLYIRDRVKDMIVSGGENIYPAEVEAVLRSHPDAADAAVIGVPHQRWGEAVNALIVRREGVDFVPDGLIEYCRDRLGGYKIPKSVEFLDVLSPKFFRENS